MTISGLVSDRLDVTGRSTVSEVRNKNISSLHQPDASPLGSTRQLTQTRKEKAAVAEAAAVR